MKNDLKALLKSIQENENKVTPDIDPQELVQMMLDEIGSLDAELRDDLIYSSFSQLIVGGQLDEELLRSVMNQVIDERHLFYKIQKNDPEAVFTRTFSILIVAVLIYYHREHPLFDTSEMDGIYRAVINYAKQEQDLRGWEDDYGWAHSTAHTADALDELALCSEIGRKELLEILEIVKSKITVGRYVYIHEEDERLITAVMNIMARDEISETDILDWTASFENLEQPEERIKQYALKVNVKNFLRSFYFRCLKAGEEQIASGLLVSLMK